MTSFAERRAMPGLLNKLRSQEDTMDAAVARRLAMAIAPYGGLLPKEEGAWIIRTTLMQGAILIRKLLGRLPMSEREATAVAIIQKAQPLNFAGDCFRWMQQLKDDSQTDTVIAEESQLVVAQPLVARIRDAASEAPLYVSFGNESPQLFWNWKRNGSPGEMEAHLRGRLSEEQDAVDDFLDVFPGRAWGMESGLSSRSDFDRSAYDRVANLIDAAFIVERLEAKYGQEFKHDQEGVPKSQVQWERRTA